MFNTSLSEKLKKGTPTNGNTLVSASGTDEYRRSRNPIGRRADRKSLLDAKTDLTYAPAVRQEADSPMRELKGRKTFFSETRAEKYG